jgi:hypothetical protein
MEPAADSDSTGNSQSAARRAESPARSPITAAARNGACDPTHLSVPNNTKARSGMKFIIEFPVRAGNKNRAVEAFEKRGPNRSPGVTFHGAWIGTHTDVVFALVESADESLVTTAAKSWTETGDFRITEVIDIEQF